MDLANAKSSLFEEVFEQVNDDQELSDRAGEFVLAACDGPKALDEALRNSGTTPVPEPRAKETPEAGVFLAGIGIRGFRGVGEETRLSLLPGPGLTVVVGRNGSGKSSFAEGAELALTGKNARWGEPLSAVWRDGWRNLHTTGHASVSVDLVHSGQDGKTSVSRTWLPTDQLDGGAWTQQVAGSKVQPFDQTRWQESLQVFRPFLPYSELGKLIGGQPSELFAALHRLLGLEMVATARKSLAEHRIRLKKDVEAVRVRKQGILAELAGSTDERAKHASTLLSKQKPDLDAIADLALGTDVPVSDIALLRRLADLVVPTADEVDRCRVMLADALKNATEATSESARSALLDGDILQTAMARHESIGDGLCPVCETGDLDASWRAKAAERLTAMRAMADHLKAAGERLDAAQTASWGLCGPPPVDLTGAAHLVDTTAAGNAWTAWHGCVTINNPTELRDALLSRHRSLSTTVDALRTAARAQTAILDCIWRPLAATLMEWHGQAEASRAQVRLLADVTAAEDWINKAAARFRVARMEPFAKQSQEVWRKLRQQSNVDLGAITLEGTAKNNQRVALNVTVDGVENTALAVMSQGELHALGLALFLPRATVDDSPFRFIVIDDPVQAMDPSKVDGLAAVLADTALTRQVVVFTHDERLAEAVRRLRLPATVWEVCRRERSVVEFRPSDSPISRYLSDARALAREKDVPDELRSELVASFCRSALEAASHSKVRQVRLVRGVSHAEVEKALEDAHTTHQKATLAVFDDSGQTAQTKLFPHLNNKLGPWAVDTLKACKTGAHVGYSGNLKDLIDNAGKLADWLCR
ncbi:MAG: AAA family ATPase [Umezawaea sp.]